MGVISVKYTGCYEYDINDNRFGNPPTYISVNLELYKKDGKIIAENNNVKLESSFYTFSSGNFIKDWFDMRKTIINSEYELPIACSSTVDGFIMGGAPYESAYLRMEDNKPVLKYVDTTDPLWVLDESLSGIEFFVPEGTKPTIEELIEMCK